MPVLTECSFMSKLILLLENKDEHLQDNFFVVDGPNFS